MRTARTPTGIGPVVRLALLANIAAAMSASWATASNEPRVEATPLGKQPYRVHWTLAAAPDVPPTTAERWRVDVAHECRARLGDFWRIEYAPRSVATWEQLGSSSHAASAYDVEIVSFLDSNGGEFRLHGRLQQHALEHNAEPPAATSRDVRRLGAVTLNQAFRAFRARARVTRNYGDQIWLELQGGEFPTLDPSCSLAEPGDRMEASLLFRNQAGDVQRTQSIPWTLIAVDSRDGAELSGTPESGLRQPFASKSRGRVETWGSIVRPIHDGTRLTLATQTRPPRPLAVHSVELYRDRPPARPRSQRPALDAPIDANAPPADASRRLVELLTDRRGQVTIPVQPDDRRVWIAVWSGDSLLGRAPMIPGSQKSLTLELPDDSIRLQTAGDLAIVEADLIDLVARRATLVAGIRRALKAAKPKDAGRWYAEFAKLPTVDSLQARVAGVRTAALDRAKATRQPQLAGRINRLCDDAAAVVQRHLNSDRLKLLSEEIDELNRTALDPVD